MFRFADCFKGGIYFEKIVFDGVPADDLIEFDEFNGFVDHSAENLTVENLYVRVSSLDGRITFNRMLELMEAGDYDAFYIDAGQEPTFFEKVAQFFTDALHAISVAINKIAEWFKKH